jgi:hypothetical protein
MEDIKMSGLQTKDMDQIEVVDEAQISKSAEPMPFGHQHDDIDVLIVDEPEMFGAGEEDFGVSEEEMEPIMVFVPGSDKPFEEKVPEEEEEQDAKDTDWANDKDTSKFIAYMKSKLTKIPRHSGNTIPGCERAAAFLKQCENELSQAMRSDIDGKIDEQEIDTIRKQIRVWVDRLEQQIERLKKNASFEVRMVSDGECKKCGSIAPMWHDIKNDTHVCLRCEHNEKHDSLEKTAATPVLNVYVTPFERAVVGIMINSQVSAGHSIEDTYEKLKNKYNFTPREELAIQQLVSDYGYPVFKDRGLINEPSDPAAGNGVDWMTQYQA